MAYNPQALFPSASNLALHQSSIPLMNALDDREKENEELKLANSQKDRAVIEQLADLYGIIITTEKLEQAYVRDCIAADEYTRECQKLIAQYKTLRDAVSDYVPNIESFMGEYKMSCKAAANRLIAKGVPATVEHAAAAPDKDKGEELSVFHAVQAFITSLDAVKLNMSHVDELSPGLNDLIDALNKVSGLPSEHEAKVKVRDWIGRLHNMRASDELSADDIRQLSYDLETGYREFHNFLRDKRGR